MAYSEGKGIQSEAISEGMGEGGGFLRSFFPGANYCSSVVAHPLIISVARPLQGKIEIIRPCIYMNKKRFSHSLPLKQLHFA